MKSRRQPKTATRSRRSPTQTAHARAQQRVETGRRLSPEQRRRQILAAASVLLTERGAAGVEITEVALRAGVTRPVVYRFFTTRAALLSSLLEDLERSLDARFKQALVQVATGELEDTVRAFVEACCDVIEEKGSGAWRLLGSTHGEEEWHQIGREVHGRMIGPWLPLIAQRTGLSAKDTRELVRIVVAAGRAALDGYIDGEQHRPHAVERATRSVYALLRALSRE